MRSGTTRTLGFQYRKSAAFQGGDTMNKNSRENSRRVPPQRRTHLAKATSAREKYEQYLALARAEDGNGDAIAAQNYYQHAEHYFRASTNPETTSP